MELSLSCGDTAFRDEVRAFISENYPQEMRVPNPETDLTKEQTLLWHRILHKKGWIAPLWLSDELNVGHYFKRISSINVQFGDPTYHLMRYAQQNDTGVSSDAAFATASNQR